MNMYVEMEFSDSPWVSRRDSMVDQPRQADGPRRLLARQKLIESGIVHDRFLSGRP